MSAVYQINKGVNRPLEFKGLKAQYIGFLAGGLVILLVLFAVLYICGLPLYFCLPVILFAGLMLFHHVFRMSKKFGQHGLLKLQAKRQLPGYLRITSRKLFVHLNPSVYGKGN